MLGLPPEAIVPALTGPPIDRSAVVAAAEVAEPIDLAVPEKRPLRQTGMTYVFLLLNSQNFRNFHLRPVGDLSGVRKNDPNQRHLAESRGTFLTVNANV